MHKDFDLLIPNEYKIFFWYINEYLKCLFWEGKFFYNWNKQKKFFIIDDSYLNNQLKQKNGSFSLMRGDFIMATEETGAIEIFNSSKIFWFLI